MNRKLFYAMALCAILFVIASEHAIPAEGQATKKSTLRTQNPAVKEIFDACTGKPDLAKVKKLVAANPKLVNARNDVGTPLIHFAAMFSRDLKLHKPIVEFLLEQGADLKAVDSLGQTALHYAAMTGRPEIVNLFLERKMDVNAKSKQGRTPLHSAVRFFTEAVALLIDKGANVNAKDDDGNTPLHLAANQASVIDTLKILLAKGAELNVENNKYLTPLDMANLNNKYEFAAFLKSKGGKGLGD